jgi:hypothetical protein
MSIDNGGPAFPLDLTVEGDHRWGYGMMLRDYFAAKALPSFLTRYNFDEEEAARRAYAYADAMIAERKAQP